MDRRRLAFLTLLPLVVGAGLGAASLKPGEVNAALGAAVVTPAVSGPVFGVPVTARQPLGSRTGQVRPSRGSAAPVEFLTVRVRNGAEVGVRARPGGRILTTVGEETEFGSPRTLGVVEQRGDWLGVVSPELGNGEIGWIPAGAEVVVAHTSISIRIDLSRRELVLRDGGEVLLRVEVAVGATGSPTPIGRFAVTDKIPGARYGSYYGCCILALSARQASLPEGWTGGDRIAIHGTDTPASIGAASSAGCLRAADDDLRVLMRRVPLGTPVFIHP